MKTSMGILSAFIFLLALLAGCAPAPAETPILPTSLPSSAPPAPTPVPPTSSPSPTLPAVTPTSAAAPLFTLECRLVKMALQGSRPPNVYGGTGEFFGSGNPEIEVLQIEITGESGQITSDGEVTSELGADWLQVIVRVNDQWTYSDSKNVYKVAGKIAYDLPDVETISSYEMRVSGGGFGPVSQNCTKP